jgi:hypothetical protein
VIEKTQRRRKRQDRSYVVYELRVSGLSYIGITARTRSTPLRSVWDRWQKHQSRCRNENKAWPLYEAMRKYGAESFEYSVVETLRGRQNAYAREREIIRDRKPKLNLA